MHQPIRKNQIRGQIKSQRLALASHEIDEASEVISHKLVTLERFKASSIIFLYAAKKEEVQTKYIFNLAKKMNKQIAFPKVCNKTKTISFYLVDSLDELVTHTYGRIVLDEPDPSRHLAIIPTNETVMIAPGLVFDYNKNRIGYGGGFYDKYLDKYPVYVIGVCFALQIVETFESEPFDKPVDLIVSEKEIIY
ncbi:MAG: 5-formyltetrahydrofolate cyclo-ligase [Cellulosilyticaceae bacterium]